MEGRGALLRIDLSSRKIEAQPLPRELCRKYLGGEGINSYLLWDYFLRVDPGIDPLGPENVLIAGLGPLGGTGYGGGSKMKWTFKSPAYGIFGDSVSGGFFGPQLRWAGYEHMLITGKASEPVYIWIEDDRVEIRDARKLWGQDTETVTEQLRKELGEGVEVACCGPAAEKGVTFSSIVVSGHRLAGRAGGGAVMASKNLKAIAVRGTRGLPVADPKGFFQALNAMRDAQNKLPARQRDGWKTFGTLMITGHYQRVGVNAYRNNQFAAVPEEKYERLSHRWYLQNMANTCFSCSVGCLWACGGGYQVRGNPDHRLAGRESYKPEYAIVASFGIMCDIPDLPESSYLGDLTRRYGVDVIEAGSVVALLMELYQRGIITDSDLQEWTGKSLTLEWGNYAAAAQVLESLSTQKDTLGQLIKGGVYQAALKIGELKGCDALQFALYGKGGATFIEEVRHTPSWGVNMAVASRGACHLKGFGTLDKANRPDIAQFYFGSAEAANPASTKFKGASSAVSENRSALINSLGICQFLNFFDPITYPTELFAQAVNALTGESYSAADLDRVGERVVNLEKAFNSRLGLRREDDKLCHRWLEEPVPNGPGQGVKAADYLEQLKDEYYTWHGWDPKTSLQTRQRLLELDMADVAAALEKAGAVV